MRDRTTGGRAGGWATELVGQLVVQRGGAAAIEFALIGPLFLMLTFGILEMGLDLFTQAVLDDATRHAGRNLQIGLDNSAATVTLDVCNELGLVVNDCAAGLTVYATSGATFGTLPVAAINTVGQLTPHTFTAGAPGSDVVLQVAYTRGFTLPYFAGLIGGGGSDTLLSTTVFQQEP